MESLLFRKLFSFSNDGFACHFVIYETFYDFLKRHQEERENGLFVFPKAKIAFLKFQGVVVNMRTRQQQHCQEKWS